MAHRVAQGFIVAAQQVHKKHVFPRTPAHGPRLDLAQADVAKRKHAERLEQRSRNILHAERQRGLVRIALIRSPRLSALDQKEAGKVLLVVLDAALQNLSLINFSRSPARDTSRIVEALRDYVLHASRSIVKRHRLEFRILREEIAALIERYRMREHAPNISQLCAVRRDQVVHDAQTKLLHNVN